MKTKLLTKLRKEANDLYKIGVKWHNNDATFQVVCRNHRKSDVLSEHSMISNAKSSLKIYRDKYILSRIQDIRYHKLLKKFK